MSSIDIVMVSVVERDALATNVFGNLNRGASRAPFCTKVSLAQAKAATDSLAPTGGGPRFCGHGIM